MKRPLSLLALLAVFPPALSADVGDPTLRTDHPHYAGEGAFQTVEDCVRFATAREAGAQDKAIALFNWLLTHQFHLMSPQEWCVPGRAPDTANPGDYEAVVYDANRARFSYGYGLCGTVHAWNEPYWRALGMPARRRAFPGHVNSEVFYAGSWHAFDTDMAGLLFRKDGVVAGYDDIARDPTLAESVRPPLPHYPFAWPGDFDTMRKGWQEVAKGGNWHKLYNGGYAAHPGVVRLRAGETFTRYFDRDHFGGPSKRRFWHHQKGGPFRDWTFLNRGTPFHNGPESNCRGNASYGNAEFVYAPDLSGRRWREGAVSATANVGHRPMSPHLHSTDGKPASVVFAHFSPYVICGDPDDDANPMTGPATGGLVLEGRAAGTVRAEVSADEGQTWQEAGELREQFRIDLTDRVKGRYGWRIRFSWDGESGLDDVTFTTVCQTSQAIYPRLKPGGTTVTYRAASRGVVGVLPNLGLPEEQVRPFEEVSLRSKNLAYRGGGPKSRLAYETTDNKPASLVFRVEAPAPLREVRAAVRYAVRVPPPEKCDFRMEVSTDGGETWQEFARADIPADNEHSSGWLAGTADVTAAKANRALVRVHLYAGGHRTGLIDAQLYGVYQTGEPQPVTLTYAWKEGTERKTHTEQIPAGVREKAFRIATGDKVEDVSVQMEVPR